MKGTLYLNGEPIARDVHVGVDYGAAGDESVMAELVRGRYVSSHVVRGPEAAVLYEYVQALEREHRAARHLQQRAWLWFHWHQLVESCARQIGIERLFGEGVGEFRTRVVKQILGDA